MVMTSLQYKMCVQLMRTKNDSLKDTKGGMILASAQDSGCIPQKIGIPGQRTPGQSLFHGAKELRIY